MKKKISMFLCIVMVLSTILGNAPAFEVRAAETVYGTGATFEKDDVHETIKPFDEMPHTYEATIFLPEDTNTNKRVGVVLGNYDDRVSDKPTCINFEIIEKCQPRLYFYDTDTNTGYSYGFTGVSIPLGEVVRLTIVHDSNKMICYLNGEQVGEMQKAPSSPYLDVADLPKIKPSSKQVVGNDFRKDKTNPRFKGTIYDISVWSDVRTPEEIASSYIGRLDAEDDNLIAAYDFTASENQNTDLSGNGYNLATTPTIGTSETPVRNVHTTTAMTSGLSFDGTPSYETEKKLTGEPHTISTWVNLPTTHSARGGVIFGNYKYAKVPCLNFEIHENGKPKLYAIAPDGSVIANDTFNKDIRSDGWVHLAITIDGNEAFCYFNGVAINSEPIVLEYDTIVEDINTPYALGGDLRDGNAQYFKGRILELSLYEEVLSAEDIMSLYTDGTTQIEANPFADYKLHVAEQDEDIVDCTGNKNDIIAKPYFFTEKEEVRDYAYSFAVVGDTQIVTEDDVNNGKQNLAEVYDWILENKTSKNIQYVFGLGDITDNNTEAEWDHAKEQIEKLNGEIPYSLVRGNHDLVGYKDSTNTDYLTNKLGTSEYKSQLGENSGFYSNKDISNSWRTFTVGEVDYLLFALDFGPSDEVLSWASEIISRYPEHQVIITTHAYQFRDGTTLSSGEVCPPVGNGGYNNGDHMWDKLVSKHENIVLVMSGHDPSENIVMSQEKGEKGNVVTSLLIDPQGVDAAEIAAGNEPTGMVAMLYFTEDGKHVQVEYYSTVRGQFYKPHNQFEFTIKIDSCERVVQPFTADKVEEYIAGTNYYPTLENYLFAGWYTNKECDETCVYAENTPGETVYALFVPDDVLSVKAQITSTLTDGDVTNDSKASIRFVTTVDSLLYSQVGFELSYVGADNRTYKATSVSDTVHKRLYTIDSNSNVWCKTPASTFCGLSKYFRACTIKNLSTDFYNTKFTVKPYWITADGDKVYGKEVTKSIADGCVRDEVWVSSGETSGEAPYYGSYEYPFSSLNYALDYVSDEGTVRVKDTVTVASGETWTEHGKSVEITDDDNDTDTETLSFAAKDICIDDAVTFSDINLNFASSDTTNRVFAEGHKLVIEDSVTVSNQGKALQVLGGSLTTDVDSTDIALYAGSYTRIYGGGASKNVLGDTNVIVGAGVNESCDETSHSSTYSLFGGCYSGTVNGDVNVTVLEGAKFNYVYGGGEHKDSVIKGTTNVNFAGNAMSVYGGSMNGTNADTYVSMTDGKVEQIFGGCYANSMTGNTNIQVTGGTVVRRVYGGCYNQTGDYYLKGMTPAVDFTTDYSVKGHTNVSIGENATLEYDFTETVDLSIFEIPVPVDNALYAVSRHERVLAGEWGTFIFNTNTYADTYEGKLGYQDSYFKNDFSTQSYHYLITTNGNRVDNAYGKVSSASDCIYIEPAEGYVATVTYTDKDNETKTVHYTADEISYYPLPALTSKNDMVEIYVEFGTTPQTVFSGYEAKIGSSYYLTEEEANIAAEKLEDATIVTRKYGTGATFTDTSANCEITKVLESGDTPRTFEATIKLPTDLKGSRGGVIFGNHYSGNTGVINFEVQADGTPRLYYNSTTVGSKGLGFTGVKVNTGVPVRVTIVVDANEIRCYVNGKLAGTPIAGDTSAYLSIVPSVKHTIGNDLRTGDRETPRFKGEIYDISLWSDVRTPEEIATSSIKNVNTSDYKDNLIAAYDFRNSYNPVYENASFHTDLSGNGYDLSGTLNVGTASAPTLGVYTKSCDTAGRTFAATIQEKDKVPVATAPYTVASWIYLTSTSDRNGVIWGNYASSTNNVVSFEIYSNGVPRFFYVNGSGTVSDLKFNDAKLSAGEWVHLAFTVSGNNVSCYVNGVLKQTMTSTTCDIDLETVSTTYVIGGDLRSGNAQYFKGNMLGIDLYEDSLTASEIKKLYNAGNLVINKNPLASYEFLTAE